MIKNHFENILKYLLIELESFAIVLLTFDPHLSTFTFVAYAAHASLFSNINMKRIKRQTGKKVNVFVRCS